MPRRANTAHARRHPFHRLAAAWLVVLTIGLVVLSTVFVYQFYLPKPVGFAHGLSAGSLTTDAIVYDVQSIGGVTYLTGAFSNVGLHAGGLAKLDPSTAALSASLPGVPSGSSVFTLVSDGSSGWYAGGNFSTIGGVAVARLAHILSDGTVDANWNPNPSAQVNSLVLDGTTLYVGGQFTTIGGQSRRFLGAVSASTGLATSFNSANSLTGGTQVRVIKSDGTSLYVGGDFTGPAARLVRFSLSGGTYDATWTPTAPNADVYGLDVSSASVVYVVGAFTTPRNFAVAYGKPAGATQAWAPAGIGSARDVILSGSTTYLAWTTGLKGFDATSGATLSWDASPGGLEVSDIELNGTTLYAAGAFTSIGGQTRHYLAALDTTVNSNNATAWNPSAGSVAKFVTRVGSDVIAGGGFTLMNGQARNGVAAVDPATQSLLPFTQNVATPIYSIAGSGNTLYIASPQAITAIDATTGGSVWQVIVDGNATVLRLDGSTLYAGGYFTSQGHIFYDDEACYSGCYVADNTRNHAMAIDATNGNLLPWDPNVTTSSGQPVKDLAVGTDTIYIGGSSVTAVGGTARVGLAAVVKSTGAVTAWDPAIAPAAASINRIILSGTTLYVGGTFTSIGGAARTGLAALDTAVNSNMATAWNPTLSPAGLTTMALTGTTMFIGSGSLSTVNGLSRPRLAVVTTTVDSGASMVGAWNPDISAAGLIDMEVWDSKLYIAGDFTNVGTNGNPRLGAFDLSSVNFSPTSATVSESAGSVSSLG
ncbi:MAG: PQQ-binding-like beta-propeller repeat protein [Candidatus Andersenbacteria bacterium]